MDFPLSGIHVQCALLVFVWGVNKNLNCQNFCQQPHCSTLRRDSLSCREYQLRWHLMRIIIIVRLHVYFRFSCFKYEACVTLSHNLFLSPYTQVHTNTVNPWLCVTVSFGPSGFAAMQSLLHWCLYIKHFAHFATKIIIIVIVFIIFLIINISNITIKLDWDCISSTFLR